MTSTTFVDTPQSYLVDAVAGALRDSLDCAFESFIRDQIDTESITEHVGRLCANRIQHLDEHLERVCEAIVQEMVDREFRRKSLPRKIWRFLTQKVSRCD